MTPERLAGWTPVSFNADPPAPSIDWGDMRSTRFAEPFFDQTVARWAGASPPPALIRTDLDAMRLLDQAPSLDPDGLIFHCARCGSTLVSRLLAQLPGTLVVAEPSPLNDLLLADLAGVDDAARAELLRLMVRALGRRRFGDEARYVLKLSSWNITRLDLFRRAFPGAPVVWVQRDPADIMASLLADPPGWLAPALAPLLFGIDAGEARRLDPAAWCARALAALLEAAGRLAQDGRSLVVDYADLPQAAWTGIARFLDIRLDAEHAARLAEEARFYSKAAVPRVFTGDAAARRDTARSVSALAAERAEPLYRALDRRRLGQNP
jgi:hypothetical protein